MAGAEECAWAPLGRPGRRVAKKPLQVLRGLGRPMSPATLLHLLRGGLGLGVPERGGSGMLGGKGWLCVCSAGGCLCTSQQWM